MRARICIAIAAFASVSALDACGTPDAAKMDPPGSVRIEGKSAEPACGVYSHICEAKVHSVDGRALDPFQADAVVAPGIHVLRLICRVEFAPAAANAALQARVRNWSSRVMKVNLVAGMRYKVRYVLDHEDCRLSLVEKDSERELSDLPP